MGFSNKRFALSILARATGLVALAPLRSASVAGQRRAVEVRIFSGRQLLVFRMALFLFFVKSSTRLIPNVRLNLCGHRPFRAPRKSENGWLHRRDKWHD